MIKMEKAGKEKSKAESWSDYITKHSFALNLEEGVFIWVIHGKLQNHSRDQARRAKRGREHHFNRLCQC